MGEPSKLSAEARLGLMDAYRSVTGVMLVSDACEGAALTELEDAGLVNDALQLTPAGLAYRKNASPA